MPDQNGAVRRFYFWAGIVGAEAAFVAGVLVGIML